MSVRVYVGVHACEMCGGGGGGGGVVTVLRYGEELWDVDEH